MTWAERNQTESNVVRFHEQGGNVPFWCVGLSMPWSLSRWRSRRRLGAVHSFCFETSRKLSTFPRCTSGGSEERMRFPPRGDRISVWTSATPKSARSRKLSGMERCEHREQICSLGKQRKWREVISIVRPQLFFIYKTIMVFEPYPSTKLGKNRNIWYELDSKVWIILITGQKM